MRSIVRSIAVACCAIAVFGADLASAEKRVALVIGNGSYAHIAALPNVRNDASAIAALFKAAKFDAVDVKHNLGVAELRRALREFAGRAADADVAVLFYAGHGIEVGQVNYLIPVDARLVTDFDVEDETVPLDRVLQAMEPAKRLRLVLLDACRENPFAKSMKRTVAARSIGRGLGRIEPSITNTLIAFATKPNAIAEDGKGSNSPFTAALVKHLLTPGLDLRIALGHVRDDVLKSTASKQEPYVTGSLGGGIVSIAGVAAKPGVVPPPTPLSAADRMWAVVKDTASIPALEAFRQQYGKENPVYDRLAEARIVELRKQQVAMVKTEEDRKLAGAKKERAEEANLLRPGRSFRDCPDVCPEMVVLPAGQFIMGSDVHNNEKPPRKVTIRRPFAVGKYEVTFAEWDACVAGGGCTSNPEPGDGGWGRGRRPVINVSWHDAREYVAWLSRKTGKTYRLLSEAEWEYAARAGSATQFAPTQANYRGGGTVEVGSFPANGFGLNDMHGNVWEWVEDAWHSNYQGAPIDGSVWSGGNAFLRVVRGGSWTTYSFSQMAERDRMPPGIRDRGVGFRLSRTL